MRFLVTGQEMKAIDQRSVEEYGIPSLVLMERAALEVAAIAQKFLEKTKGKTIFAVCGFGNNGADGVAAARMMHLKGIESTILLPDADGSRSHEMEVQLEIAKKLGIPVCTVNQVQEKQCDVIVDALFGIGLTRPVEGAYRELIEFIWKQADLYGAKVVSVDIPSGISSDTGAVMGCAVRADATVTFGERKLGQVLFPGREACGELTTADIGFVPEDEKTAGTHARMHTREDLDTIPKRAAYSHKGTYGKVLIIAGSKNMAGAAYFAAKASYRTGAGLVKIMTPEENRLMLQEKLPEAILSVYDTEQALQEPELFRENVGKQTEWADVIVLGPGIGTGECSRTLVEAVLSNAYVPIILDADAINLAARYPYLKNYFTENIILTPHLLECARLMETSVETIRENLIESAKKVAERFGVSCVLKDAATVTVRKDGLVFVNQSGSPAMAKGGSGDVLCGVIAGFLALGMEECDAASLGVYIHGLAGEAAERKFGAHSVLAGELADCIGEVINERM